MRSCPDSETRKIEACLRLSICLILRVLVYSHIYVLRITYYYTRAGKQFKLHGHKAAFVFGNAATAIDAQLLGRVKDAPPILTGDLDHDMGVLSTEEAGQLKGERIPFVSRHI